MTAKAYHTSMPLLSKKLNGGGVTSCYIIYCENVSKAPASEI